LGFNEIFALVARLESIHILLAYDTHHDFKLYQIDINSAFLNGPIKEEVYMEQLSGLKMKNILTIYTNSIKYSMGLNKLQGYGINDLEIFLLKIVLGLVSRITLFTRKMDKDLFVYQIYVDDIIFGSTNASFCEEFSKIMIDRFEIYMMEELKYFLRFQIKQFEDGAFISQIKYTFDLLKKFGMDKAKSIKTPIGTNGHLNLDMGGNSVHQKYIAQ
jgi:hypothetical protein